MQWPCSHVYKRNTEKPCLRTKRLCKEMKWKLLIDLYLRTAALIIKAVVCLSQDWFTICSYWTSVQYLVLFDVKVHRCRRAFIYNSTIWCLTQPKFPFESGSAWGYFLFIVSGSVFCGFLCGGKSLNISTKLVEKWVELCFAHLAKPWGSSPKPYSGYR